jgi:hypothetical protein
MSISAYAAVNPASAFVMLHITFSDGGQSWGSGVFVDHDGLILTADHVLHRTQPEPLTTLVNGAPPVAATPTKVEAYSTELSDYVVVDLSSPENVLGGAIGPSLWIDAALVRASLNPIQRARIHPLDISPSAVGQSQIVSAWGPHCIDYESNLNCELADAIQPISVASNASRLRDITLDGNFSRGFSGGPIVNDGGMIVGIGSWGFQPDGAPVSGKQIVKMIYLPSNWILKLLMPRLKPSAWFANPEGCVNTDKLDLTILDARQLIPVARQISAAADCTCCCQRLKQAANAPNLPLPQIKCPQIKDCGAWEVMSLASIIRLDHLTDSVDQHTVDSYLAMRTAMANVKRAKLDGKDQDTAFEAFTSASISLLEDPNNSKYPELQPVLSDTSAAIRAWSTTDSSFIVYQHLHNMFAAVGDTKNAYAAQIISDYKKQPDDVKKSVKGNFNVHGLERSLVRNLPKNLDQQLAVEPSKGGKS